jgi:uncharacterized protein YwgA
MIDREMEKEVARFSDKLNKGVFKIANPPKPVYKRQRFLLSFIKELDEPCTETELQKLLFLYQSLNGHAYYDFIPYMYGCYSIQAAEDIETLHTMKWIILTEKKIQYAFADTGVRNTALLFDNITGFNLQYLPKERGRKLIKLIYEWYPYYAINSHVIDEMLDKKVRARIEAEKERITQFEQVLFTIGYEGLSVEKYLNLLIENDVRVLCDVRNNPLSRKLGFSKKSLQNYLGHIGIEYTHIPELGIVSEKRNGISSDMDYTHLFKDYKNSLSTRTEALKRVYQILQEKTRVALTCFEHEPAHCHRHVIRDYFKEKYSTKTRDI